MKVTIQPDLLKSLLVLASIIEAKDPYTGGHIWRVSQYAKKIGQALGLAKEEIFALEIGAFLHDLGKVGIPDQILKSKEKLSAEEMAIIQTHPEIGADILQQHPLEELVSDVVLHHHETPNGKGYPHQQRSKGISLFSRIVGVADSFDAMTSSRSYRAGMSIEKAISILNKESGVQFDGEVVKAFLVIPNNDISHIVGHSDEGIPLIDCLGCGGTIQVKRTSKSGDKAICRCCSNVLILHQAKQTDRSHTFDIEHAGKHAQPSELKPSSRLDSEVIEDFLSESLKVAVVPE
jgi:HD superfamily phosphohydrolase YqeK